MLNKKLQQINKKINPQNSIYMKTFNDFDIQFERLKSKLGDTLSRNLRLFNIRFRLAHDILIDFKGEISMTKTLDVRNTYKIIIKLMETWNSYEALYHYVKELGKYCNPKENITKKYSQSFLDKIGSLSLLKTKLDIIKGLYESDSNFKDDFSQLIERFIKDDRISPKLKESCKNVLDYFENKKTISGIEIIALIYAERNMYYHNGETAKMGMRYLNRQNLINIYQDCLEKHILILATHIIQNEI